MNPLSDPFFWALIVSLAMNVVLIGFALCILDRTRQRAHRLEARIRALELLRQWTERHP